MTEGKVFFVQEFALDPQNAADFHRTELSELVYLQKDCMERFFDVLEEFNILVRCLHNRILNGEEEKNCVDVRLLSTSVSRATLKETMDRIESRPGFRKWIPTRAEQEKRLGDPCSSGGMGTKKE